MVIMGLKRFTNQELTSIIKAAGTLQFGDDMLLDRTSQQLMLTVNKMTAEELFNLVMLHMPWPASWLKLQTCRLYLLLHTVQAQLTPAVRGHLEACHASEPL